MCCRGLNDGDTEGQISRSKRHNRTASGALHGAIDGAAEGLNDGHTGDQ